MHKVKHMEKNSEVRPDPKLGQEPGTSTECQEMENSELLAARLSEKAAVAIFSPTMSPNMKY